MHRKLFLIINTLHEVHGSNNWMLSQPIIVRLSSAAFHLFQIHGLCVSPKKDLFIMDDKGKWHTFDHQDKNADKMIDALYIRLSQVYKTKIQEFA